MLALLVWQIRPVKNPRQAATKCEDVKVDLLRQLEAIPNLNAVRKFKYLSGCSAAGWAFLCLKSHVIFTVALCLWLLQQSLV